MKRDPDSVPSPCISICRMEITSHGDGLNLCAGCLRTIDEIVEWGRASDDRKREILHAVAGRRPS